MLLNKPIGQSTSKEEAISGEAFAEEMYNWKSQGKDITVKINSLGGSVKYGWDMVDSIIETKAKTENIGFAYSMAGIALIVGSDRTAYPHSRAMIHAPRRADGKSDLHTSLIMDQFRTILKNHTKFTEAEINEMIDSGKDYFFDAKQMLEKGMIDRIANSGGYNNDVMNLSEVEAYTYINQLETNNQEMEFLNKFFGGKTESESMVNAVQMKAEYDSLKVVKAQLDSEIAALKAENESLKAEKGNGDKKVKAIELIASAKSAGKLNGVSKEDEAKWVENATANYEFIKGVIDTMPSGKIVAVAASQASAQPGNGDMTYEFLAKHNPEELNRIAESDPALFTKLQDAHIAKMKEAAK